MADVGISIVSSLNRLMMDDKRSVFSSSSVHKVVSNDNLLIEILLRLPAVSLFFFKSVSKRWLSLITSSFFNLRVSRFPNIDPSCGFLLQDKNNSNTYKYYFVSLNSRIRQSKKKKSAFTFGCFGSDANNVKVLQSCNGLVLCVIRTNPADKIYVYNPSLNMFKMLPEVDGFKHKRILDKIRLAFDPAKSPHYKVLHTQRIGLSLIQTRIYSSETGCWRKGDNILFPVKWAYGHLDIGVYWNDAIHWLDVENWVMHFNLDIAHPHISSTKPPVTLTLDEDSYQQLFESRGCLLLAYSHNPYSHDPYSKRLEIYEKTDGYFEWSARYVVKYGDAIAAFLQTWKISPVGFHFNVLFMVEGEREEESFAVMNLDGKVVKYNLLSKTLRMVCDIDEHLTKLRIFPFIASFAGV